MAMPRFHDATGWYEIVLFCPKCGWAIPFDNVTQDWDKCRNVTIRPGGGLDLKNRCNVTLVKQRIDHGKNLSPWERP